MDEDYNDSQDSVNGGNERSNPSTGDGADDKMGNNGDFGECSEYDDHFDEDGGGNFYNNRGRGRGNFRARGRGPPPGWMNGPPGMGPPPMRFRGRGFGPNGPPMRGGRGNFFRGRGGRGGFGPGPGPNFEGGWGGMGMGMGGPGMMAPPFAPPPMMGGAPPHMGPPPNMMQGPPFPGPPNMPPPNMPQPELWVETKSEDGKPYYYHARSRETTWTRPQEGPALKVITQSEMEAMAASNHPAHQAMGAGGMGMPNGMLGGGGGGPGGMQQVPPFMPPWMAKPDAAKSSPGNQIREENSGEGSDDAPPGDNAASHQPNAGGGAGSGGGAFGMSGPPPGFPAPWGGPWGAPPAWPPAMMPPVNQPPPSVGGVGGAASLPALAQPAAAMTQPPAQLAPQTHLGQTAAAPLGHATVVPAAAALSQPALSQPSVLAMMQGAGAGVGQAGTHVKITETVQIDLSPVKADETPSVPAELAARAAEWTTHKAPDGRAYYYHAKRQESVWEKPQPLKELEEFQAKIAAHQSGDDKADKTNTDRPTPMQTTEVIDVDAIDDEAQEAAAKAAAERERHEKEKAEKEKLEKEKAEKEKAEKEKAEKEKQMKDKILPMSTTPIYGTPWCVVWTGDGRVFFYNPTSHTSVWERPLQLMGRADVDKAVSSPPESLLEMERREAAAAKAANGELKRATDDSADSDSEPDAKKAKPDDSKKASTIAAPGVAQIEMGGEAAKEAEVRAAKERASIPLEARLKSFKQMLLDKAVSAFSTWEKELHKIVFDPRYLLLTSKERKQVFEAYVKERAEEERKEKRNRLKQKRDHFKQLMEEAKLHSKSSFSEFSSKYAKDERYKGIEKMRERESLFNEYIVDVRKRDKEEKIHKREQVKKEFIALLKEKEIDRHARWSDVKKKVDSDARYKAVESSTQREDLFKEYCKIVKEEKKKEKEVKEKDRESKSSSKKDKKDRDREKDREDKEKDKEKKEKKEKKSDESSGVGGGGDGVEDGGDGAGGAGGGAGAGAGGGPEEAAARERERAARELASLKERERQVQRELATSLRDREKEREYHKRDEAVQHFNALLADLVRNPDLTWREARKQLKSDSRYDLADQLTKEDKERLFGAHIAAAAGKRRDKLRELLAELGVGAGDRWRDVKRTLKDEPRTPKFATSDKMEREFREYQRECQVGARAALRQLLLETRALTHKSLAAARASTAHMQQLHDALKGDARYTALDQVAEERDQIIMSYLEELEKKGPPPPPTATEPSRRSKQ